MFKSALIALRADVKQTFHFEIFFMKTLNGKVQNHQCLAACTTFDIYSYRTHHIILRLVGFYLTWRLNWTRGQLRLCRSTSVVLTRSACARCALRAGHVWSDLARSWTTCCARFKNTTKKEPRGKRSRGAPTDDSEQHVVQQQGDENNEEDQFPRLPLLPEPFEQVELPELIQPPHGSVS